MTARPHPSDSEASRSSPLAFFGFAFPERALLSLFAAGSFPWLAG